MTRITEHFAIFEKNVGKSGLLEVRQIKDKNTWLRKEIHFSTKNLISREQAMEEAIDYANKAVPYE